MNYKIGIVNSSSFGRIFPEHMKKLMSLGKIERFDLPKNIKGKALAERLMGYAVIIASVTALYDREFFEYKDQTLLIARHGIGYNNIDIQAATEKGTIVTKVDALVEQEAVAENAIALLMSGMRQVRTASLKARQGKWQERANFIGHEIKNKTVGIIGLGNIGRRVGEILKNGFYARVIAYDPNLSDQEIKNRGAEPVTLEELLRSSDIISINACVTSQNYHMLSTEEFSLMKTGVFLVNTARGELLDEHALIQALDQKKIAGLGLDVVEGEPIDETHPLFAYENVIITPHTSAYTYECLKGMGEQVVMDVEKVLGGQTPDTVVNPEVLKGLGDRS